MRLTRLLTGLVLTVLAVTLPASPALAQPQIWESDFGAVVAALTGEDDDTEALVLSFNFPYEGTNYLTVYVGTNGCVQLGDLGTDGDIDYDHWSYFEEFIDDAAPELCPINSDWDLSTTGTIHFNDFGDRAVVTWNEIGTDANETALVSFQIQLFDTGRIVFGYNGILDGPTEDLLADMGEGFVVGITLSDNNDPGPANLNGGAFTAGATAYERWCYDTADSCGYNGGASEGLTGGVNTEFDLDQHNVVFEPQEGGGFAVSSLGTPTVLAIPTLDRTGIALLIAVLGALSLLALRRRARA